jgi:hypothetical protein
MLAISLDKRYYSPGETVAATITVRQAKPLKARGVFASLVCHRRRKIKTTVVLDKYDFERDREMSQPYSSHMETRTEEREEDIFRQEKQACGPRTFSGEEAFTVQFALPQNAQPTSHEFGHDNKTHVWKIAAKLDIPLAPDENAEAEVVVEGL